MYTWKEKMPHNLRTKFDDAGHKSYLHIINSGEILHTDKTIGFIWYCILELDFSMFFNNFLVSNLCILYKSPSSQNEFMKSSILQNSNRKFWRISALKSKKWWNQQNKGTFLLYNTLNSPYNYMTYVNYKIIRKSLYFVDLTTF